MQGFVRTQEKSSQCASQHFSSVLTNTQVLYNCTQHMDKFSIAFLKYKSLRSFVRAVGSYKAHATANQIARNMSVII
jgi:hypothetical protein